MPPTELSDLRRGKYAKIDAAVDDDSPTRPSFDSNASSYEDLEEYDPLNYDAGTLKRKKSTGALRTRKPSYKDAEIAAAGRLKQKPSRNCGPRQWCCWLLIFVAAVVLLFT